MSGKAIPGAAALACSIAFGAMVMAQGAPTQPPGQRSPQGAQDLRNLDGQTLTVTGCLMREADVPGQTPDVAERAGVAPDYILTNVQVRSASPSGAARPGAPDKPETGAPGAPGAAASSGARGMNLKLTDVDNDEMKENLNKQIEVTGRLDVQGGMPGAAPRPGGTTGGTTPRPGAGANQDRELPELEVQSVRALNQPCKSQ